MVISYKCSFTYSDNAGSSAGDISEVAETGGERMSLYKAGATARYQEVSKYVFRDVATIETDQSKKVNINFRLVGRYCKTTCIS